MCHLSLNFERGRYRCRLDFVTEIATDREQLLPIVRYHWRVRARQYFNGRFRAELALPIRATFCFGAPARREPRPKREPFRPNVGATNRALFSTEHFSCVSLYVYTHINTNATLHLTCVYAKKKIIRKRSYYSVRIVFH